MANITLPRDFFYGVVIITLVVSLFMGITYTIIDGSLGSDTSADLITQEQARQLNNSFNSYEEVQRLGDNLSTSINRLTPKEGDNIYTLSQAFINSAWNIVLFITGSLGILDDVFRSVANYLAIPGYVVALLLILIVILFVFSIISLIFGKDT